MSKVYMLIGIQGSGKSTYARVMGKEKNIPTVSSDLIRTEMNIWDETDVFPYVYKRCADYIKNNIDFIYLRLPGVHLPHLLVNDFLVIRLCKEL